MAWMIFVWLETGPYALLVWLQVSWSGSYNLEWTRIACGVAGLFPVILYAYQNFSRFRRFVPRVLKLATVLMLALSISCFLKFKFSAPAPTFERFDDIEANAGLISRLFIANDLLRQFDFSKATGIESGENSAGDIRVFYVPLREGLVRDSITDFVLRLTDGQMDKLLGSYAEPETQEDLAAVDTAPESSNAAVAVATWAVARRPLPYLIRKEFGSEGALPLSVVVSTGETKRTEWLLASIISLLGFCGFLFITIKDRKLWKE